MMGGKRGRSAASSANQERVRTHLFFSSHPERQLQKRKRRTQNKLHQVTHKKDEMIQVGELDPSQWTGNQRVLHFGPMARRDPYFYYYPKGWDILYPAHFGFFPYRTTKFRGSSSLICVCAFGCFLVLGGSLMIYLGYSVVHDSPFWTWPTERRYQPPPIQIAGPILFASGALLLLISLLYTIFTSNLCKNHLLGSKTREVSKLTTITTYYRSPPPIFEKHPYQPLPPPAYPVLENKYAHSSMVRPHDENKLYPPVIPGCSTLSLHGKSPSAIFVASPYNTLRATSVARYHSGVLEGASGILENRRTGSVVSRRQSSESSFKQRSRSMGPLHRTSSNRSRSRMLVFGDQLKTRSNDLLMDVDDSLHDENLHNGQPQNGVPHIRRQFSYKNISTINFAIPHGYSMDLEYLGGGAYGNVVKSVVTCRDGKERLVAIKKLRDPFHDANQARRIYREIRLLQLMKHDNIIRALDLYTPNATEDEFREIYIVTEYAGYSLASILRNQKNNGSVLIGHDHVRFIVYQLLRAVKYLHSATIIHRDLKPGNLALTKECDLTVLDFGLARSLEGRNTGLTEYVMTRWYRSPEVIYWKIGSYSTQADIWSVGCIAAELMLGSPLFNGEDPNTQYETITQIVGSPSEELLNKIELDNGTSMRGVIQSFNQYERIDFFAAFRDYGEDFADFLDKILVLDPEQRLTVDGALAHPYMAELHDPADEPAANWSLNDESQMSLGQWKNVIWQEVLRFVGDEESPALPPN